MLVIAAQSSMQRRACSVTRVQPDSQLSTVAAAKPATGAVYMQAASLQNQQQLSQHTPHTR